MWSTRDIGGDSLAVSYSASDERQIQAELTRLDPDLFLDKEIEPNGPQGAFVYFCVKQRVGMNEPICVLEWREPYGPKPLTFAIVDQVKRREGRIREAFVEAVVANERRRTQAVEKVGDDAYEIAKDARKIHGTSGAVLPRSPGLRRARDRARSKGEKR